MVTMLMLSVPAENIWQYPESVRTPDLLDFLFLRLSDLRNFFFLNAKEIFANSYYNLAIQFYVFEIIWYNYSALYLKIYVIS